MHKPKLSRRTFMAMSGAAAASFALNWNQIEAWASQMGPMKDYPTVIIGAGLGGLTAGAYLARQGVPVTVIEQHNIPGGYATTFERGQGKFNFEVSLHATAAGNDNAEQRVLQELGVWDEIEMAYLPEQYTIMTPELTLRVPQKDPEGYIKLLARYFPDEAEGITGFVQYMAEVAKEGQKVMEDTPSLDGWKFYLTFPFKYPKMFGMLNRTLDDILARYKIKDPKLREILCATWPYYGLPPSTLSANYFLNPTGDYMLNGAYYVKRRSQTLSNAMADVIEANGGEIIYDTTVEKILTRDGEVSGVVADGETIPAKAVVSNASALTTFFDMLPQDTLPSHYKKKVSKYQVSMGSFIVWLGLNRDITDLVQDYEIFITSGRGPEADYQSFLNGDVENSQFLVALYDNAYKGYSQPGTSSVSIIVLSGWKPWEPFFEDYKAGNKEAYYGMKKAWADILIRRTQEKLIPGLSSMIEVMDASTPLTNWDYTGNPQGAIYGFDHGLDNDFVTRIQNNTPVKGLYLASAWGNPGAGYGGVIAGGAMTFHKLMKHWGG